MPISSPIRDDKRTEEVKLRLTERELLDVSRLAALDERSITEYIVRELRRAMYGSIGVKAVGLQGPTGDGEGR